MSSLRNPHILPMSELKFTQTSTVLTKLRKGTSKRYLNTNFVKLGKQSKGKETAKVIMNRATWQEKTLMTKDILYRKNAITTQKYRINRLNKVEPYYHTIN